MKKFFVPTLGEAKEKAKEILAVTDGWAENSSANCVCGETQCVNVYEHIDDSTHWHSSIVVCTICAHD